MNTSVCPICRWLIAASVEHAEDHDFRETSPRSMSKLLEPGARSTVDPESGPDCTRPTSSPVPLHDHQNTITVNNIWQWQQHASGDRSVHCTVLPHGGKNDPEAQHRWSGHVQL